MKGIKFNDIHSYYDLGLILSKCEIEPASPKTNYIEIPCADGSIDLSEANGEIKYNNRNVKFTFSVINENFEEKKMEICNLLNGVKCKITLDKDADFYFLGRCTVGEHKKEKKIGNITISAVCNPYKYRQNETIRTYNLDGEEKTITIENGRKSVVPIIENEQDLKITFENKLINLKAGKNMSPNLILKFGMNTIKLLGNGEVKFTYQEGEL